MSGETLAIIALCLFYFWLLALTFADAASKGHELRCAKEDIEVLRIAMFVHVRHGGDPCEEHIREVLGYGDRE